MRTALSLVVPLVACSAMPAERPMPAVKDPASSSAPGVERRAPVSTPALPADAPRFRRWEGAPGGAPADAAEGGQGGAG